MLASKRQFYPLHFPQNPQNPLLTSPTSMALSIPKVTRHLHSSYSLWHCLFSSTPSHPPHPIPNRPLRNQNRTPPPKPKPKSNSTYQTLSDEDFLHKLKLGLHKNKDSDSVTTDRENFDSAPPPADADQLFQKMKETGLIPNAVAMLDGLCKDGLVQEALKLFGSMREKGTIPDVVIYTAVVEAFCKAHKFDDAKRIFRKMIDNGILPNAFTYTVLVQAFYKSNYLDDAIHFCLQMLEAGHSPNVTTFVGLIDAFCRNKGVEEAQSIVTKLRQNGFFLNDKAITDFLDKKGAVSSLVPEAVFGKKSTRVHLDPSFVITSRRMRNDLCRSDLEKGSTILLFGGRTRNIRNY